MEKRGGAREERFAPKEIGSVKLHLYMNDYKILNVRKKYPWEKVRQNPDRSTGIVMLVPYH
jgi:hypothetical protein